MTIRHIRIFLGVCDHGCNTTRAAQALHMTQPAVSLAIRELEAYYGVRLFDRIGRRLALTEAGQRFQEYSRRIAALFDDMERELRNPDGLGLLRVGASITIGTQFLPHYIKAFSQRYPKVDVRAEVISSDRLEDPAAEQRSGFCPDGGGTPQPGHPSEPYMEDRLAVICPRKGPFGRGRC